MSQGLAYVNGANNAIIKVDNTSNVAFNQKRNTVSGLFFGERRSFNFERRFVSPRRILMSLGVSG